MWVFRRKKEMRQCGRHGQRRAQTGDTCVPDWSQIATRGGGGGVACARTAVLYCTAAVLMHTLAFETDSERMNNAKNGLRLHEDANYKVKEVILDCYK